MFAMDIRSVLKLTVIYQPHMPQLYEVGIVKSVFDILNYPECSVLGIFPLKTNCVTHIRIVADTVKSSVPGHHILNLKFKALRCLMDPMEVLAYTLS